MELQDKIKQQGYIDVEDIKNLKMIHHLLRQKKFTIDGAKEFIKKNKQAEENYAVIETLQKLKTFLNELKANL